MSNYQQKYSNGGVDHQTIADEIMSILGRLDALEGKGAVQNMADSIHLPYCENWEGATSFMINGVKYVPESCPAPEPTSEPKPCYLVDAVTGEPRSRLFAEYGDAHEVFGYNPATLPQVRADAVRLGLLDTKRQKVAEAFLHQALITFAISKSEWHLASASEQFLAIAKVLRGKECYGYADVLERMASVLKAAAKG
jgi:hypothetical protein